MNCPVCARSLAPTLSICPSCGAMMNDSVREELQTKITSGRLRPMAGPVETTAATPEAKPVSMSFVDEPAPVFKKEPIVRESAVPVPDPPPVRRRVTADLLPPKTSPTLVEFQTTKKSVPDWRLQVQNAVQQRVGVAAKVAAPAAAPAIAARPAAAQPQAIERPALNIPEGTDPRVAAAMRRVNESRETFLPKRPVMRPVGVAEARPFNVVAPRPATPPQATAAPMRPVSAAAPARAATAIRVDTNKLPKLETVVAEQPAIAPGPKKAPIRLVAAPAPVIDEADLEERQPTGEFQKIDRIRLRAEHLEIEAPETDEEAYADEIEDLASFSMRFGAGLFDLIIAGFVSMLLLSPVAFSGSNWLTPGGAAIFAAVMAVVTFIYMTVSLGFYGRTIGMRLFSLELVDAGENEYPTLQQAAVNSAVFVVGLPLLGAGFLTVFFNEENRALHDLLSGTILVREF